MSYVTINNLSKAFDDNRVFDDISFTIDKGEFITLLGPSGCGKSTLLRSIAGLNSIDEGEIWVEEENITHLAPQKRGIGMVFQSYALFPNMTTYDNIGFGLKMQGMTKSQSHQEISRFIELVELQGKEKQYPQELSGGE